MVYVLPLLFFVVALLIGMVAMQHRRGWLVLLLAGLGVLVALWAIWQGRQLPGFDGIGYAMVAVLMAAPAVLGVLVGGLVGWFRRRQASAG